jgi:anti-repressor protein
MDYYLTKLEILIMEFREIIPVAEHNGETTVSARELHKFLEVETLYRLWHKRMFEQGLKENFDYVAIVQKSTTAQGNETTFTDHLLTLDAAKIISMLQRNEKGDQARRYFIEVEKQAKAMYKQLQQVEQKQKSDADAELNELFPKVLKECEINKVSLLKTRKERK